MNEAQPTVLVVDDEPADVRALEAILGEAYRIVTAGSGPDALDLAVSERPDLVLLDVATGDGYEVCRRLKADERTRAIPVLFLTGQGADEARGFEAGGADFIAKPVSAPLVLARVSSQVELKGYRDRLEALSWQDGLTGIANRRHFDAYLEHEWQRARRAGTRLAVLIADLDWFKPFNDRYGHLAGDECLRTVAAALARSLKRGTDLLARFGGEEFACALPETHTDGAVEVAHRFRDAVAGCAIEHLAGVAPGRVSVSVGVAGTIPRKGVEPVHLLDAVERSVQAAKAAGRNRVGPVESIRLSFDGTPDTDDP